jgi:hypothetical protein
MPETVEAGRAASAKAIANYGYWLTTAARGEQRGISEPLRLPASSLATPPSGGVDGNRSAMVDCPRASASSTCRRPTSQVASDHGRRFAAAHG